VIEGAPLAIAFVLVCIFLAKYTYKATCLNLNKKQRVDHFPPLIASTLVLFRIMYLYLVRHGAPACLAPRGLCVARDRWRARPIRTATLRRHPTTAM